MIKPDPTPMKLRDANKRVINTVGAINLAVNIGGWVDMVNFKVIKRLEAQDILR